HFLGEGTLGSEFDFQFAAEQLTLEQGVFTDVGGDHLTNLSVFEQDAQAETVDAAVVGNNGQASDAHAFDFCDEVFRNAAQAKSTGKHCHVVGQPSEGFLISRNSFVESSHD